MLHLQLKLHLELPQYVLTGRINSNLYDHNACKSRSDSTCNCKGIICRCGFVNFCNSITCGHTFLCNSVTYDKMMSLFLLLKMYQRCKMFALLLSLQLQPYHLMNLMYMFCKVVTLHKHNLRPCW